MTRKQIRSLIFTQVNTFNSPLAEVYFENLEGPTDKGNTFVRVSIRFGSSTATALGEATDTGVLFVQVFIKDDTGGAVKDNIVDEFVSLFDYKLFTDPNGTIQFRGGSEAIAPSDGGYVQSQYSIPFEHYKEI